ncbi:MAG: PAS domain S-box protein [Syntrophotaleaceae bacterium]
MILFLEGNDHDQQAAQALLQESGFTFSVRGSDGPCAGAWPGTAEEDLLLAFMEHFIDGIVIMDVETAGVKYANRAFAEMLGYSLKEVHSLKVWDWDAAWSQNELKRMYATRNWPGERFETRYRRKDGQVLDVAISHKPIAYQGQEVVFCLVRDISDRKQAESASYPIHRG